MSYRFENYSFGSFFLVYPENEIEVQTIDDVKSVFETCGATDLWSLYFNSIEYGHATVDASSRQQIKLEIYDKQRSPEREALSVAEALQLRPLLQTVRSAFVAHGFDHIGKAYANEVRTFLDLLGIEVTTGEYFEPKSVSNKVKERIGQSDVFIAIVTPQEDRTWIIQETTLADTLGKHPIVLVEHSADHKRGLRGDSEDVFFPHGHISDSFVRIMQGLRSITGSRTSGFRH